MKLWQKVFLITLASVILAVNVTAIIVLQNNFEIMIERERSQSAVRQDYLSATISNNVAYTRLKNGQLFLKEEEVVNVAKKIISDQTNGSISAVIQGENHIISSDISSMLSAKAAQNHATGSVNVEIILSQPDFVSQVAVSKHCLTFICDAAHNTYLITGSRIRLEGEVYSLYTLSDITALYNGYEEQLKFAQMLSIIFACALALILLVIIFQLLRPLSRVNNTLRMIAMGDYSQRLPKKGAAEFHELADSINTMAEAVEESMERIKGIADSRKQFINNLAHEMKTPLTSIMGFADILQIKRNVDDKQRREYAGIIVDEAKRLKNLSGKLLELATTDSVGLDFEEVPAKQFIEELYASVYPVLYKRQIAMKVTCGDISLTVDKELFKSLLYNIIDNAIKASPDGGEIRISCIRRGSKIHITVSDDGIGMSRENVLKVTEPFYMVDKSRSRKAGGAGLGLALCAEIAKRHNAKLGIKSELGKGTTITVILPSQGKGENA